MGIVRILPDKLANQIAAGEVVERPVSALKELVENALDAGATRIKVEVDAGGKKRIRVEDNGTGMDREDCLMALERHATSKLTRSEDLFSIKTLGFRGEALPSIASVSRFTLESRQKEAAFGVRVMVNGSKLRDVVEIQKAPGTTVLVENLFYNIPARRKFLRTTETELSWIVNLMTTYSFAHVDTFFSLAHNGKTLFSVTPVKTLKERIFQHYGRNLIEDLLPLDHTEGEFRFHGLISKPHVRKTSRNYQYLFVNGRLVRDKMLNHAIFEAYKEFGESRQYPVIFLFIECPSQEVDVNVHPAKTEIKFIHSNQVHQWVVEGMRNVLLTVPQVTPWRPKDRFQRGSSSEEQGPVPSQPKLPFTENRGSERETRSFLNAGPAVSGTGSDYQTGSATPYARFLREKQELFTETEAGGEDGGLSGKEEVKDPSSIVDHAVAARNEAPEIPRVIGQYKESFILAEEEDALLLIDQHVAHERILFDQIFESYREGNIETQLLLIPLTIDLTPAQVVRLEECLPLLKSFGFDLDRFDSNTFVIREIPAFLPDSNMQTMVLELIEKAQGKRGETAIEALIQHMAAMKACKAAVKINMRLNPEKMQHLVDTLYRSQTPLFCPHGRPIVLRMTDVEIEKNFLRR